VLKGYSTTAERQSKVPVGRFRKLLLSNDNVKESIIDTAGALALMRHVGFELQGSGEGQSLIMPQPSARLTQARDRACTPSHTLLGLRRIRPLRFRAQRMRRWSACDGSAPRSCARAGRAGRCAFRPPGQGAMRSGTPLFLTFLIAVSRTLFCGAPSARRSACPSPFWSAPVCALP
jgi:hypothetical protein